MGIAFLGGSLHPGKPALREQWPEQDRPGDNQQTKSPRAVPRVWIDSFCTGEHERNRKRESTHQVSHECDEQHGNHTPPLRSAEWHSAVSPTGSRQASRERAVCGLPIRDTADCQSALRFRAGFISPSRILQHATRGSGASQPHARRVVPPSALPPATHWP